MQHKNVQFSDKVEMIDGCAQNGPDEGFQDIKKAISENLKCLGVSEVIDEVSEKDQAK